MYIYNLQKKRLWSRQNNWQESRSRETEVGEKIAVITFYVVCIAVKVFYED